jgi:hypothetical protein
MGDPAAELTEFISAFERGIPAALVAAGNVYLGALKPKLQAGYTSGEFTQGIQAAAAQLSEPAFEEGGWVIVAGTNELVSLFWEIGHQNLFTRRYERVEYWRETLEETQPAMAAAFADEMAAQLERTA